MTDKIKLKITEAFAKEHFGPRCETHEPGCGTCEAWKEYDETGGYMLYENDELVNLIAEGYELMDMIHDMQDRFVEMEHQLAELAAYKRIN